MKTKLIMVIALVALVSLMIVPVNGVSETGNFSSKSYSQILNVNSFGGNANIYLENIQVTISERTNLNGVDFILLSYDGSPLEKIANDGSSNISSTRFTSSYGDGYIGYNIIKYTAPFAGYVYILFDNPISIVGTGPLSFPLTYSYSDLDSVSLIYGGQTEGSLWRDSTNTPMAGIKVGSYYFAPNTADKVKLYNNVIRKFENSYEITLDQESGVVDGIVYKTLDGVNYPSRVYIYGYQNNLLGGDGALKTADFNFKLFDYPLKLSIIDSFNVWHNTTFLFSQQQSNYILSVSPDSGTINNNFTATSAIDGLGTVGDGINQFTIACSAPGTLGVCVSNNTDPVFIKQQDGFWYQDQQKLSTAFPASVPLNFNEPGTYTVTGYYFPSDISLPGIEATDTVTVTASTGDIKLRVEVRDATTNGIVVAPDILVKMEDGTWNNQTVGIGFRDYYIRGGSLVGVGATAPGYYDTNVQYSRFYADSKWTVLLNRILPVGVPEGNNTLSVYVRKGGGTDVTGLEGATIRLDDGQTKLTPGSGLSQFLVLDNETYFITVSKPGYLTASKYFTVNGAINAVTVDLYIPGVSTTPTLAPGETTAPVDAAVTYPPGVPMPGTTITYPPGVPVIGAAGDSTTVNGSAREIAQRNIDTWMIWGGTFLLAILVIMFIGFSGDALKKWSWLWK